MCFQRAAYAARFLMVGVLSASAIVGGSAQSADNSRYRPTLAVPETLQPYLKQLEPGSDGFPLERDAKELAARLGELSEAIRGGGSRAAAVTARLLDPGFRGARLLPPDSVERQAPLVVERTADLSRDDTLDSRVFPAELLRLTADVRAVAVAEFLVTAIAADGADDPPSALRTTVRYDIVGAGARSYRVEHVGDWAISWKRDASGWRIIRWTAVSHVVSRARDPIFTEITAAALAGNDSFRRQLAIDLDSWMATFDSVVTRDSNGHQGVSAGDADGDGLDDLYVAQPAGLPNRLYRNRGDGTFEDITDAAGVGVLDDTSQSIFADIDNDGDQDLIVATSAGPLLFVNDGHAHFTAVRDAFRFARPLQGVLTSMTMADYDRDGFLDLFVCNYVQWSEATDIFCTLDGVSKSYCTPESYQGATNRLFRNRGNGTFEDVSRRAGVYEPTGKSLGVVAFDYDEDGWPDLAVANDTQPNFLYHNRRDGSFEEIGVSAGIGFGEDGRARGAMGIDAADYDGSGRESLLIGNFANEMLALYHNAGKGIFLDEAPVSGIGQPSLLTLAFGCFFFDYDLDSSPDIFVANGHVETDIERVQPSVTYAEPPHLFKGVGGGRFEPVTRESGESLVVPRVGRGAAYADIDGDGDLDVAMTTNNGEAVLLRNGGETGNDWIRIQLSGGARNRDAIGAKVTLKTGSLTQTRWLRSAASYASQSETVLTFGLGPHSGGVAARTPVEVEVVWPDGKTQRFTGLAPGKLHKLEKAP